MTNEDYKDLGLPELPGVYYFKKGTDILYIGRATSLRDRVKSYFSADLEKTRGLRMVGMTSIAENIEWKETDSVLEAIILEANEIKKHKPYFNIRDKDDRSFHFVVMTKEDFPRVLLMRGRNLDETQYKEVFGPFPSSGTLTIALKIIRKIFPFRDKCEVSVGKPCFNAQIGLCPGVCSGVISKAEYAKTIKHITLFLQGKKEKLIDNLEKDMNTHAKKMEFEQAEKVKRTLFALTHVHDMSLIREEYIGERTGFRVEAYDVAHLGGKNAAGVMVVAYDDAMDRASYRKFRIRHGEGPHEVASLTEVLKRRLNHPEWPLPDLIVVDGNEVQRKAAISVVGSISVVAVVKNEKHKPKAILGDAELITKYKKIILLANSEAHRFSLAYHRLLRSRMV